MEQTNNTVDIFTLAEATLQGKPVTRVGWLLSSWRSRPDQLIGFTDALDVYLAAPVIYRKRNEWNYRSRPDRDHAKMTLAKVLKKYGHKTGDAGSRAPWKLGPKPAEEVMMRTLLTNIHVLPGLLPGPTEPEPESDNLRVAKRAIETLEKNIADLQSDLATLKANYQRELAIELRTLWARNLLTTPTRLDDASLEALRREIVLMQEKTDK